MLRFYCDWVIILIISGTQCVHVDVANYSYLWLPPECVYLTAPCPECVAITAASNLISSCICGINKCSIHTVACSTVLQLKVIFAC